MKRKSLLSNVNVVQNELFESFGGASIYRIDNEKRRKTLSSPTEKPRHNRLNNNEGQQLLNTLLSSVKSQQSMSVILIGPSGSDRTLLLDEVINDFIECTKVTTNSSVKNKNGKIDDNITRVARISGHITESDHEALISLANQFMIRPSTESNFSLALEDLEVHFKRSKMNNAPAIVILDEFQVFAKRARQVLIYTLLDLMHDAENLFVMIGLTGNADIHTMLEKRVVSRLNAQYLYLSTPNADEICNYLANHFIVTIPTQPDMNLTAINESIRQLFGEYRYSDSRESNSKENDSNVDSEEIRSYHDYDDNVGYGQQYLQVISRGELFHEIKKLVLWGLNFRYFRMVAITTVSLLSCSASNFTTTSVFSHASDVSSIQHSVSMDKSFFRDAFLQAIHSFESPTVTEQLSNLPHLELNLMVCASRLHCNSKLPRKEFMVSALLEELDKLTNYLRHKIVPKYRILSGIINLCQLGLLIISTANNNNNDLSIRSFHSTTVCFLSIPYAEIKRSFRVTNPTSQSQIIMSTKAIPRIIVSERIRRAALEPLIPLAYSLET
eukprot:gene9933-13362_t